MKFLLSFLMAVILITAGLVAYGVDLYKQPNRLEEPATITIAKGTGARQIAEDLENRKLIPDKWVFLAALKLGGNKLVLKAGEYEIAPQATMADILNQLAGGKVIQRKVTIPEGRTSFEIVEILNKAPNLSGEVTDIPAEGTLLPDTYLYMKGDGRASKIAEMEQAMKDLKKDVWDKRGKDLPFSTWEEALTLASIVEKETGVASERKRIAGVFINRLRRGIPLQSDPTVIYALTKGRPENEGQGPLGRRLLAKDLDVDSPYNTYKYAGLPPAPIANPGREAIEAVLHPEPNDFLYFVADGTGGHVFSATLADHNKNVAKWRKIRQSGAHSAGERKEQ